MMKTKSVDNVQDCTHLRCVQTVYCTKKHGHDVLRLFRVLKLVIIRREMKVATVQEASAPFPFRQTKALKN